MTGLIPVGTRSMYHSRNNYMPFVLGHQFNKLEWPVRPITTILIPIIKGIRPTQI